jgi:hypothetical protein
MIPVMGFATIGLSNRWDYGKLNLHFTQYDRVNQNGSLLPNKHATARTGVLGQQTV